MFGDIPSSWVSDTTPEAPAYVSAEVEDSAYAMNEAYDYAIQDEAHSLNMQLTEALVFNPRMFVPNYETVAFFSSNSNFISWVLSNPVL